MALLTCEVPSRQAAQYNFLHLSLLLHECARILPDGQKPQRRILDLKGIVVFLREPDPAPWTDLVCNPVAVRAHFHEEEEFGTVFDFERGDWDPGQFCIKLTGWAFAGKLEGLRQCMIIVDRPTRDLASQGFIAGAGNRDGCWWGGESKIEESGGWRCRSRLAR